MSLRILISGTTGDSMPPPYAGVQHVSLLYARTWKKMGHRVALTFVYRPENSDDLGANAEYFFEYNSKPNKFKKLFFLLKYFFKNPILYFYLFTKYFKIYPKFRIETFLYSSYGVWVEGVISNFKPDIITCQAALIKTFMVAEIAKMKSIPVVFEPYAEIHDLKMGVNKHLNEKKRERYWKYFLSLSQLVIGMDNCSVGPLMYLPKEKVKVFYDTTDFGLYQVAPKESRDEIMSSFGLPKDMFFLAMMGAFHYRKGHDHLIKAVSILNKKGYKDIGGVIVGGDVGKEKWEDLIKQEGLENNVFLFQNFNEDKKIKLYKSIDGYCNLSNSTRSCGLDLALLEAMSCGLPIIVYDNGALPGAVPTGDNGFVVQTGDISALADAILKLYKKNIIERKVMAEKSKEIASKTDVNLTAKIKEEWFLKLVNDFK